MKLPYLDITSQTEAVAEDFLESVRDLLSRNQFIGGPAVLRFEKAFAAYCGVKHCVALNSGTDALRLALLAGGLTQNDEIITSPFTFVATAEAVSQVGRLALADIDSESFCLCPASVSERLTPITKGVVPVHIFGMPAPMDEILKIAREYQLFVVEDACQAHGAEFQGIKTGAWGDAGAFSFYPSKNLGAFGDAGALTCHSSDLAEKVRLLRNHGQTRPYIHEFEGYNSRMDAIQASLLTLKLSRLDEWNKRRKDLTEIFKQELSGVEEVRFQRISEGSTHGLHILAAVVEARAELVEFLLTNGVETKVVYPEPIHLMAAYKRLGLKRGDLPNAENVADHVLSFPLYPGMREDQAEFAARLVKKFYSRPRVHKMV